MLRRGTAEARRLAVWTACAVAMFALCLVSRGSAQNGVSYWRFEEGAGQTASDGSGGHTARLSGQAGWTHDTRWGIAALHTAGDGSAEVAEPLVDTSRSFTVSAWVRVNRPGGFQTFVSIDGKKVSAFYLQLRNNGTFAFTLMPEDNTQPGAVAGCANPVQPGTWHNLVGVYDAEQQNASLFVDGVLQDSVRASHPWRAEGPTAFGRGRYDGRPVDFAQADIDEVRLEAGVHVDRTELSRIARETHALEAELMIDTAASGPAIDPKLYGLMIEDINHSIDGGLYAELIQNRTFLDDPNRPVHWSLIGGDAAGSIALDRGQPIPGTALTTSLRLESQGGAGVANDGYWGIPVRSNTRYQASFYARAASGFSGPLDVAIESADGSHRCAHVLVNRLSLEWKRYTVALRTASCETSAQNRFLISVRGKGTVWLNQVSLFPPTWNGRRNGTRPDLMRLLGEMKPAFLRLPGGNFLEGDDLPNRFDWKRTVGDIARRPGHRNPWAYRSTDGFGLLEYLEWCEDLKMEPLLAVFAGYTLNGTHVNPGQDLEPYVQDALDEIEYVVGDTRTKWGAARAADGHPKPFPLQYVEIGNEDFFDRSGSYEGRFAQFFDAIRARYPRLQLIATRGDVKSRRPDVVDDHFYSPVKEFERDWKHYDRYDRRGPKIFVGEYAAQDIDTPWERPNEMGPTPDLNAALGDAAWMIGMERNADVVALASYAPLLVNINPGARQWAINLVGFDALRSFGSPSYYVQKLFSLYRGDRVVPTQMKAEQNLAYVVNRVEKNGTLYVKVVNPTGAPISTRIILTGGKATPERGTATVLTSGRVTDLNTLAAPMKVAPVTRDLDRVGLDFRYTFAPDSFTILTLHSR